MAESIETLKQRANGGDTAALFALVDAFDQAKQYKEAVGTLARAAHRGNLAAKTAIAKRILIGLNAPHLPNDGVRLLSEAATQGSGEAAAMMAVLCGVGAYRAQSWGQALDYLCRSAELAYATSRQQLALLGDKALAAEANGANPPRDIWQRLRKSIDLEAWLRSPPVITVNPDPLICRIENFIPADVCDWFIARAQGRLVRAEVYNALQRVTEIQKSRTNTSALFNLITTDLLNLIVQGRIAAACGLPFNQLEAMSVLHYAIGEEITDHFDFVNPSTPNYAEEIARNGQRVVTFLVYLNENYGGGETEFPRIKVSHKGKRGDALFFHNALANGSADVRTVHAGRPPTSGEKWLISQWIRNRPTIPGTAGPHVY